MSKSHQEADSGLENPNSIFGGEYELNCQTCTVAYLLRRWGFDIEAKSYSDYLKTNVDWKNRFLNKDGSKIDLSDSWSIKFRENIETSDLLPFFTSKTEKDGIYEIFCQWNFGDSHVFIAIKEKGTLSMHDPQFGYAVDPDDYISKMDPSNVYIQRIDDKIVNSKMLGAFLIK